MHQALWYRVAFQNLWQPFETAAEAQQRTSDLNIVLVLYVCNKRLHFIHECGILSIKNGAANV